MTKKKYDINIKRNTIYNINFYTRKNQTISTQLRKPDTLTRIPPSRELSPRNTSTLTLRGTGTSIGTGTWTGTGTTKANPHVRGPHAGCCDWGRDDGGAGWLGCCDGFWGW